MPQFVKFSLLYYISHSFTFLQIIIFANKLPTEIFKEYIVCITGFAFIHICVQNVPEKIILKYYAHAPDNIIQFSSGIAALSFLLGSLMGIVGAIILLKLYDFHIEIVTFCILFVLTAAYANLSLVIARLNQKYSEAIKNLLFVFCPATVFCLCLLTDIFTLNVYWIVSIIWSLVYSASALYSFRKFNFGYNCIPLINQNFPLENLYMIISSFINWSIVFLFVAVNEKVLDSNSFKDFSIAQRFANVVGLGLGGFVTFFQKNTLDDNHKENRKMVFLRFLMAAAITSLAGSLAYYQFFAYMKTDFEPISFMIISVSLMVGSYIGYEINPLILKYNQYRFYVFLQITLLILFWLFSSSIVMNLEIIGASLNLMLYQVITLLILDYRMRRVIAH